MKVTVELPDAFEKVEVELPEKLADWFAREAASKKLTVPELLANKTAGLTVEQLAAARRNGVDVPSYVLRWIVNQRHEIIARDGIPRG